MIPRRPRRGALSALSVLVVLASLLPFASAQAAQVDCPDSTLTSYLLALIDTLYANGLTHYESLLATLSESDGGYELLSSWYTDDALTLFVPTDAAMQKAGLTPPFDTISERGIHDIVALHTVNGNWTYSSLPQSPAKGFADSQLLLAEFTNSTAKSTAHYPLVLQQADQGAMSIRLATGNATTWGWVIHGAGEIWNIVIIPIDQVLPFAPKLSEALTMATTSRSTKGLQQFAKALDGAGGAQQLEAVNEGGFTIFAPIDDAFTEDVQRALSSGQEAVKILGNHYATNYSLFSRIWVDNGPFEMPVISGETLVVEQADSGATVKLGDQTVRILRSDIVLENGVMHIIEDVLADPVVLATASSSSKPAKSSPTSSAGAAAAEDGTSAQGTGSGSRRAGLGWRLSSALVVGTTVVVGFFS